MTANDQAFLKTLLVTFKVEAEEHIGVISSGLIELEQAPSAESRAEIIETVFRAAHSLKGAARAVNLVRIETVCQSLESHFSELKAHEILPTPDLFDRLHQMISAAGAEIAEMNKSPLAEFLQAPGDPMHSGIVHPDLPREDPSGGQPSKGGAVPRTAIAERPYLPGTVRVSTVKLDSLRCQAEELISTKAASAHCLTRLREACAAVVFWEKEWQRVRPHVRSVQRSFEKDRPAGGKDGVQVEEKRSSSSMQNILAFLECNERTLESIKSQLTDVAKCLENGQRSLDRGVTGLLDDIKRVSMLPFSSILAVFPKLVRDLCREGGKDAQLVTKGGELEAERRILEEMKDPLMHLVRNCIDHGIENPSERERKKKAPRANITVAITPEGDDKVEITVSDDGAGINVQEVLAAALRLGVISQDEAQKAAEGKALSFVFHSGVSTSPLITEVSGRGLGLAIVKERVEKAGGTVLVETQLGIGTTFRLILPLTLAAFRGILVRVGENVFVLPAAQVERVLRVARDEIKSVENRETLQFNDRAVSLVRLADVLGIPESQAARDQKGKMPAAVVAWAGEQMVVLADEILSDQEVLVKGLGRLFPRVRNISGATVMGTGKVVPVLNVADLMRSAAGAAPSPETLTDEEPVKSILIAEDSITARTLLKNIIESAGYKVKTAVDGAEAFAALGSEPFDLVVSDVDMPGMSGFDLTARIRADGKLSDLPVVLVTALESREDKERGIDAGANAYIVKSSFDQSNLLAVIRRLT